MCLVHLAPMYHFIPPSPHYRYQAAGDRESVGQEGIPDPRADLFPVCNRNPQEDQLGQCSKLNFCQVPIFQEQNPQRDDRAAAQVQEPEEAQVLGRAREFRA